MHFAHSAQARNPDATCCVSQGDRDVRLPKRAGDFAHQMDPAFAGSSGQPEPLWWDDLLDDLDDVDPGMPGHRTCRS